MTWAEVCEDKFLNSLEWRVETDRHGNIVMSPPARSRHAEYQGEILGLLNARLKGGKAYPEVPLETSEGVKAVDVAWVSRERRASRPNDPAYLIAPEICVEVLSRSNSAEELAERRRLCFEKGAVECWVCDLAGRMSFFDPAGPMEASRFCPDFPRQVEV
jgi:Uma2 family endonuclease